jgi:signal peptidase I
LETRQSSNVQGPPPAEKAKSRWHPHLWGWARDLLISIGISAFIIIFLYQPVEVEGTSMLPGLQDQERIFVNKFVYKFEAIQRGDIVVFHYPLDPSKSYIKRVVGIPGDHVRIRDGQVYVNGILLREPYVPAEYFDVRSMVETSVPPDSYFVLGDHRSMSDDSREFGSVDQRYIFGKAVLVYWPVQKLAMVH